ncbi:MAG TPA: alpha/beta hydrolase [Vicinamibacteria bacterium]|nr:alpha/beta hydrolase [Vicinamibacteria bacterium]
MPFETSLIYFPSRLLEDTPEDYGLVFEEVSLAAEDGVRLHAWWLPLARPRFTILFAHGNAGNISHRLDRARLLASRLSAQVFLFDYRGYGRSEGKPDEQGTYRDARAAHRHLTETRGVPPDRLVLFGESLGSAVALNLALERAAGALVLESPFTSIRDMARLLLPWLPLSPFLRTRYDNLAKVGRLKVPLLVVHGDRDEVVPFAQGRRVFEAAPEPKRFHRIVGAGHNDTYLRGGEAYWEALDEFLERDPPKGEGRP